MMCAHGHQRTSSRPRRTARTQGSPVRGAGVVASAEPKEVVVMEDLVAVLTLAVEMFALGLTVGLALARF
jgi:hypothetical protein